MTTLPPETKTMAIAANLDVLRSRLRHAADLAEEACTVLAAGHRNQAICTISELDRTLPKCNALLRATLVLHRVSSQALQDNGTTREDSLI